MTSAKQPASARVAAAGMILDRGYGRAPQALQVSGDMAIATLMAEINGRTRGLPSE